tara:strand:+ start:102 stop:299 length:198 start_codon:yes stop_codon:yes gene_type:complete
MDNQIITFSLSIEEFKDINNKTNLKQPIGYDLMEKLLQDHSEILKIIAFDSNFKIKWKEKYVETV